MADGAIASSRAAKNAISLAGWSSAIALGASFWAFVIWLIVR